MSFWSAETSIFGGKPIELYRFTRGSVSWRYCTSRNSIVYNGATYAPAYIKRNNIVSTGAAGRATLQITVSATNPLVAEYFAGIPTAPTRVSVYRKHVNEDEIGSVWGGRIVTVSFTDDEATLNCEPISTRLKGIGASPAYQSLCPYLLFGDQCRAVDNRISTVVQNITGRVVTLGTLPPGLTPLYFVGGVIRFGDHAWMIVGQSGPVITLSQEPVGLTNGASVSLSAGCDHTAYGVEGCQKFNNLDNFGGFPFFPDRNPFQGDPINQ